MVDGFLIRDRAYNDALRTMRNSGVAIICSLHLTAKEYEAYVAFFRYSFLLQYIVDKQ